MAVRSLGETARPHHLTKRPLDLRLVEMMTALPTRRRIQPPATRRKHPLPRPFLPRVRVLAGQRRRQLHPPRAAPEVPPMLRTHLRQMTLELRHHGLREDRHAIPIPLATSHHDLGTAEIDLLDAQSQRL